MPRTFPLTPENIPAICVELLDADFYPHGLSPSENQVLILSGKKIYHRPGARLRIQLFGRRQTFVDWQFRIESVLDCQLFYDKYADRVYEHAIAGVHLLSDNVLKIETHSGLVINVTVSNLSGELVFDDPVEGEPD